MEGIDWREGGWGTSELCENSTRQNHGTVTGREGKGNWEFLDELLDLKTKVLGGAVG